MKVNIGGFKMNPNLQAAALALTVPIIGGIYGYGILEHRVQSLEKDIDKAYLQNVNYGQALGELVNNTGEIKVVVDGISSELADMRHITTANTHSILVIETKLSLESSKEAK